MWSKKAEAYELSALLCILSGCLSVDDYPGSVNCMVKYGICVRE